MAVRVASQVFGFATAARFAPPVLLSWDESSEVSVPSAICPQLPSRLDEVMGPPRDTHPQSEQCLTLVVAAPADAAKLPVMVFFHGGGFGTGSGSMAWYSGTRLAAEGEVVVVSASYRLGPFGYLVLDGVSEGNLGLLDQIAALQWIQRHVERLGGDPGKVTVFGQSAGGMSINHLFEIAAARRLFRGAIVQSAPIGLSARTRADAVVDGAVFAAHLKRDPRTAPPAAMLDAHRATARDHAAREGNRMDPPFAPVRGAGGVPQSPDSLADLTDLDVLVGWNRDDMAAFGVALAHAPEVSAVVYADEWDPRARQLTAAGARVTGYRLDWRPAGSGFGAVHCVELPLLLGDERAWRGSPMLGREPWTRVEELGRQLRSVWSRFAHTGQVTGNLAPDVPVAWTHPLEPLRNLR
ncbi:MAG: carboxylesterase family protein [Jatrophihabitantaceae bacterium]